ncbi:hypothetical protein RKD18_006591 [Streptomyces phaeoluteigriseus]
MDHMSTDTERHLHPSALSLEIPAPAGGYLLVGSRPWRESR